MTAGPLRYLSVCSGIEAATVAWHPLGWEPRGFSDIEAFPSAVLAYRYPDVPNFGDMTQFKEWPDAEIDVLVGGTPCQSFSLAGLRAGLADPRGNLALVYLAIADRYRPEWILWENVPGVLSAGGGRDFGTLVGAMVKLGYCVAWRVLDAQYVRVDGYHRAVPQRRRRVFVVGHLGDWRRPAAVLFEPESLRWHSPPRRKAGEGAAGTLAARAGGGGQPDGGDGRHGQLVVQAYGGNRTGGPIDVATALTAHAGPNGWTDFESETFVAHSLRAEGFDASEDGTGRGTPLVAGTICRDSFNGGAGGRPEGAASGHFVPVAFSCKDSGCDAGETAPTLRAMGCDKSHHNAGGQLAVADIWSVRRLTPRECERLQGFPDDYTLIPWRGKPAADGPRYRALGNSMAVNVMRWLGRRIDMVRALAAEVSE